AVQDRLSEVRYQIESYTSTLNMYDDMVSFCTVDISLNEVNVISVDTTNFGDELMEALRGSGRAVVNFLRGFVIALIYALPFLALIGLAVFIILKLTKKARAKKRERRELLKQSVASGGFSTPAPEESSDKEGEDKN
ncbi:MAG: DUF4349 domain-containing protein, partial [Oscillospiraceae bacterium]|nr:DUF4349 domain-containing protein [Oscillospiraceae bacterium]